MTTKYWFTNLAHYLKDTPIWLSSLGYLHNLVINQDLSRGDALKVWEWLFHHQDKLQKLESDNGY